MESKVNEMRNDIELNQRSFVGVEKNSSRENGNKISFTLDGYAESWKYFSKYHFRQSHWTRLHERNTAGLNVTITRRCDVIYSKLDEHHCRRDIIYS